MTGALPRVLPVACWDQSHGSPGKATPALAALIYAGSVQMAVRWPLPLAVCAAPLP